jgi:hypothetical protein
MIGFWLIYQGTHKLLTTLKLSKKVLVSQWFMYTYIVIAAVYVYLTFQDPARQFPTHRVLVASYYEPDWLLFVTLVIPQLLYGFIAMLAIHNMWVYKAKVKGTLYKQALKYLSQGLVAVVGITVLLRCIQSLSSPLQKLNLQFLLGLIYLLLVFIAVGYGLIAKGANKLQQIEES